MTTHARHRDAGGGDSGITAVTMAISRGSAETWSRVAWPVRVTTAPGGDFWS